MNILLTLILAVNIALLMLIFVAFNKIRVAFSAIRSEYDNLREQFHAFISPGHDDKGEALPSPLASITLALADQAGRSVVSSLKASYLGQASGSSRSEKAAEADLQLGLLEAANPMLGSVVNGIPALRKIAKKNPGLIEAVMSRFGGGNGSVISNSSSNNSQNNFKI